ncbi:HAMP domain-containing sensor histidine kinase [Bdellovibrionota bacterium FG-1]
MSLALLQILLLWSIFLSARQAARQIEQTKQLGQEKLTSMATQVAHDIRSPLAALAAAEKDLSQLPEDTRITIRSSIRHIQDIANDLLAKNRAVSKGTDSQTTQLLSSLIDEMITEKRMQFRAKIGIDINGGLNGSSYGLFSKIQTTEFKRVISNLINNAVEVLGDQGKITITLKDTSEGQIQIRVQDNGKGIPPDILAKLGQRGETHGKTEGSGLGLYHARTSVESWGGRLEIESQLGRGTSVVITLPQADAPSWFVAELRLQPRSNVVVLDDDESIHRIWKGRAESARLSDSGVQLVHLSTPTDIRNWINKNATQTGPVQYLFDYELLGFKESGLDLIEELGLAGHSILVTSRYEEPAIRERCERLKVQFIPKGMAGFVPIRVVDPAPDAILIDDDNLVHLTWKASARRAKMTFLGFTSAEAFFKMAQDLAPSTPVYIDSFLGKDSQGQEVRGEEISKKISALGFKTIYLATGLTPENDKTFPWLTGIRGKEAPFNEPGFSRKTTAVAKLDEADYARIRNYFHDLLKPIQQTSNLLRGITNADAMELEEFLTALKKIPQKLEATRGNRDKIRGEMSPSELQLIHDLDQVALEGFEWIAQNVSRNFLPEEEGQTFQNSNELKSMVSTIQALSTRLSNGTSALLNQRNRG